MHARRQLLVLGAAALGWPRAVLPQPARKVTVAVISSGKSADEDFLGPPFFAEMRRRGWREGENISYERFFAEGSRRRLAEVTAAAAKKNPDLIYVPNAASGTAARKATTTIPIVFIAVSDPIANGLVASLAHPGGNATGVYHMGGDIFAKRFELVRAALPAIKQVGVLIDTRTGDYAEVKRQVEQSARPKGVVVQAFEVASLDDAVAALPRMRKAGATAVTAAPSFTLTAGRRKLAEGALRNGLALIGYRAEWAETGALFSYGADLVEAHQRSAEIADRILRGAKPADLPVERATKFEMLINLRTAKALGVTLPKSFLLRADRVIE